MKWMALLLLLPAGVLAEEGGADIFQKPSFGANYFYSPLKGGNGNAINETSIDLDLFLPVSSQFAWTFKYSRRTQEWVTPGLRTKYDGGGYNAGFRIFWE